MCDSWKVHTTEKRRSGRRLLGLTASCMFLLWTCNCLRASSVEEHLPPDLQEAVLDYWQSLERRDKAHALQYVFPEDLNNFLNRNDAPVKNPRLKDFEAENPDRFFVTVSLDLLLPNGIFPSKSRDLWVKTSDGWRIRIDKPQAVVEHIMQAVREKEPPPLPPRLEVLPKELHFYALSPRQPAALTIRNGLSTPVDVVALEIDPELVEIVETVSSVPPRTSARIVLRYKGDDVKTPNLRTSVRLTLKQEGTTTEFTIPALCNYLDKIQRWILQQGKPPSGGK